MDSPIRILQCCSGSRSAAEVSLCVSGALSWDTGDVHIGPFACSLIASAASMSIIATSTVSQKCLTVRFPP